nr:MAG TPA: hypothetical protein [Caudoviricetes sp.]
MLSIKFKHLTIALVLSGFRVRFIEPDDSIKAQFVEHFNGLCSIC